MVLLLSVCIPSQFHVSIPTFDALSTLRCVRAVHVSDFRLHISYDSRRSTLMLPVFQNCCTVYSWFRLWAVVELRWNTLCKMDMFVGQGFRANVSSMYLIGGALGTERLFLWCHVKKCGCLRLPGVCRRPEELLVLVPRWLRLARACPRIRRVACQYVAARENLPSSLWALLWT